MAEDPEPDIDLRAITGNRSDDIGQDALGGIDPRLTSIGFFGHRSRRVEHELDIDLSAGLIRGLGRAVLGSGGLGR